MRQWILRGLLYALQPLRHSTGRWTLIERMLGLKLTLHEFESVRLACDASGQSLGAYYYWKLSQVAQVMAIRRLNNRATLELIEKSDTTDYAVLSPLVCDPRGSLLAIPHHGGFVFSIVALVEKLRHQRPVYVFYDPPEVHATNEIFDVLYRRLYADPSSGVTILHNNRAGIATALKQLKQGAIVVIMPDVYKDREDTYQIPFCGRARNVMLGTAVLARRTQATILPMLSDPSDTGMGFKTRFGMLIEPSHVGTESGPRSPAVTLHEDYRTTAALFGQLEQFMCQRFIHWQYCRTHYLGEPAPPKLEAQELARLSALFLKDPRVYVNRNAPVMLE